MAFYPCCFGISLRTGAQIIAVVHMLSAGVICIGSIIYIVLTSKSLRDDSEPNPLETQETLDARRITDIALIIVATAFLIGSIFSFALSFLLWLGVRQRSLRKCKIWLYITAVLMCLVAISFIANCIGARTVRNLYSLLQSGAILIFDAYCLFVVHRFTQELKATSPGNIEEPAEQK